MSALLRWIAALALGLSLLAFALPAASDEQAQPLASESLEGNDSEERVGDDDPMHHQHQSLLEARPGARVEWTHAHPPAPPDLDGLRKPPRA